MSTDRVREGMVEILAAIAPEVDVARIAAAADLREEMDLDSMDFLRYVEKLHERFDLDIPESDYAKLRTLRSGEDYLRARLDGSRTR